MQEKQKVCESSVGKWQDIVTMCDYFLLEVAPVVQQEH